MEMKEGSKLNPKAGFSYFDSFNSGQSVTTESPLASPPIRTAKSALRDSNGKSRVKEEIKDRHDLPSNMALDSTGLGTIYLRRESIEPTAVPESFLEFDSPPPPSTRQPQADSYASTSRLPPIPASFLPSTSTIASETQLPPNLFARPSKSANRISMRDSGNYETTRRELAESNSRAQSSGASSKNSRNSSVRTPALSLAGSNSSRGSILTSSDWRRSSIDSSGEKELSTTREDLSMLSTPFSDIHTIPRLSDKRSISSTPLGGLGIEGLEVQQGVKGEEEEEVIVHVLEAKLDSPTIRPIPGRSNSELNWRKLEIKTDTPPPPGTQAQSVPNSASLSIPPVPHSNQALSTKSSFNHDLMLSGSDMTARSSLYFSEAEGDADWTPAEGDEYTRNLLAFGEQDISPRATSDLSKPMNRRRKSSNAFNGGGTVVDRSGLVMDSYTIVPKNTTHLLLKRTALPEWLPSLLHNLLPTLTHTLVVLDISYCGLLEVPSVLASCVPLQQLSLSGNPLLNSTLPSFLSSLSNLKILLADSCQLVFLPPLTSLQQLSTLSIRQNQFRSLPSWLCRLPALQILLVDGNLFHSEWARIVGPILSSIASEDLTAPVASKLATKSLGKKSKSYAEISQVGGEETTKTIINQQARERSKSIGNTPSQSTNRWLSTTSFVEPPAIPSPPPFNKMSSEPSPISGSFPTSPTTPTTADSTRKWGKIFRKTSGKSESRKVSDPMERVASMPTLEKKPSSTSTFRKRVLSLAPSKNSSPLPSPDLPSLKNDRVLKKRSSILTDSPIPLLASFHSSHSTSEFSQFSTLSTPSRASIRLPTPEQTHGLRGVIAYLRDVDDLSYEAVPASPQLRNSPSLSVVSSTKSVKVSPLNHSRSTTSPEVVLKDGRPSLQEQRLPSQYFDESVSAIPPVQVNSVSVAESATIKFKLDRSKSDHVVGEIIETEKSYVKVLLELKDIYILPASMEAVSSNGQKKADTVVPLSERKVVFGNIASIVEFHDYTFLPELITAAEALDDSASRLAQVFIRHASFLKIYSSYVTTFDAALARVLNWASDGGRPSTGSSSSGLRGKVSSTLQGSSSDLTILNQSNLTPNQKKRIKAYMKRCRTSPSHSQISLEAYLLLPVQRIPRYRMLLESLLACTPYVCADGSLRANRQIQEAFDLISGVATDMNERKRESEGKADLAYWQSRIGNTFRSPLCQPHRTLIRNGTFTLLRVVKRTSTAVGISPSEGSLDPLAPPPTKLIQLYSLHTETNQQNLIALLCTDILVLLKEPNDVNDTVSPVELFTVLRLSTSHPVDKPPPASVFGSDNMLRIACDSRAILYVKCNTRSGAMAWMKEINKVHQQSNA